MGERARPLGPPRSPPESRVPAGVRVLPAGAVRGRGRAGSGVCPGGAALAGHRLVPAGATAPLSAGKAVVSAEESVKSRTLDQPPSIYYYIFFFFPTTFHAGFKGIKSDAIKGSKNSIVHVPRHVRRAQNGFCGCSGTGAALAVLLGHLVSPRFMPWDSHVAEAP